MSKRMLIDATHSEEMRVAVVEKNTLVDFDFENLSRRPLKGNLYLAKIVRIEPSLQAAFVDYGGNRHGFLAFTEIHPDYFRIPVADRAKMEAAAKADAEEDDAEDAAPVLDLRESDAEDTSKDAVVAAKNESAEGNQPEEILAEQKEADKAEKPAPGEKRKKSKTSEERFNPYKAYRIQEVIQSRQVILVQVVKEERGNKGAALTTYVSLPGRYCVLMPNATRGGGISRRITDMGDRRRLKQLIQDLEVPENMSLIVRTAGLDRSKTEIKRDYAYLVKLWSKIREQTLKASAPDLIYEEGNLLRRAIRDLYVKEIEEVWVDGEEGYKEVKGFMKDMVPSHAKKVQRYAEKDYPLFYKYKIERQIEQMYSTEVRLKSGGYIVLNPTEALVSVDVNSGRATRERHIDSTALNTNLEAAAEIARQVRLRDLAGLIVIDFIDMTDSRHNYQVEKCFKESLSIDRARVQVGRISQFGLLEMSRQRLRPSILEASTVVCHTCAGAGVVRSAESFALQLVRVTEEICLEEPELKELTIHMPAHIAFYLLSEKRHEISQLEERYQLKLDLREDDKLSTIGFKIESKGRFITDGVGTPSKSAPSKPAPKDDAKKGKPSNKTSGKSDKKVPAKGDKNPDQKDGGKDEVKPVEVGATSPASNAPKDGASEEGKPRRNRRNRNRRRRRPSGDGQPTLQDGGNQNQQQNHQKPQAAKASTNPQTADDRNAPKGSLKKGWWQRLLDS